MIRIEMEVEIGGQRLRVPVLIDQAQLETIAAAVSHARVSAPAPPSPYMSVKEAAAYLRCERHRIDDLLSQRKLTRFKDGSRTLIARGELEEYVRKGTGSRPR